MINCKACNGSAVIKQKNFVAKCPVCNGRGMVKDDFYDFNMDDSIHLEAKNITKEQAIEHYSPITFGKYPISKTGTSSARSKFWRSSQAYFA